jgi:hypothetical protein
MQLREAQRAAEEKNTVSGASSDLGKGSRVGKEKWLILHLTFSWVSLWTNFPFLFFCCKGILGFTATGHVGHDMA